MGSLNILRSLFSRRNLWRLFWLLSILAIFMAISLLIGKLYQSWDDDPDRGAIAMQAGAFGESYSTPIYLDQGWDANDSLWYYTTTQGSALMPYDLFIALEQSDSRTPFRANSLIDKYRYLPQKPTFFNPDGLPVGFVKESYRGKDYIGMTCAACHTGQVNYKGVAIRIDGGPAMADMVGFLADLEQSLASTRADSEKNQRFVARVLELNNSYSRADEVQADLQRWTRKIQLYNNINASSVKDGYARIDAFGRIYNRVLEYVISSSQLREVLLGATRAEDEDSNLLTQEQVDKVLKGIDGPIIGDLKFAAIIERLMSTETGYPGLSKEVLNKRIKPLVFNEPNAPVSYPYLWDIVQSDYVQWNGLASNASIGPLGRNIGEVLGVFAILDWTAHKRSWSLPSLLSKQERKSYQIDFTSSVDVVNLLRLESHLASLTSPVWPTQATDNPQQKNAKAIFDRLPEWKIDKDKVRRGRKLYAVYCESCHEVIDRTDQDRIVVASIINVGVMGTDSAMAENSVNYQGYSGNFKNTYVSKAVGAMVIKDRAPVTQILTATTLGELTAGSDPDKWWPRRALDWLYLVGKSFFENEIKASVKSGNYLPDTAVAPYQSLLSYKARSLNGIWATAPFLHNGSVPSIYDLLLPVKRAGDPEDGRYRPVVFNVGSREFDPVKVGMRTEGYEGFVFSADKRGDFNSGHEYGTVHAPAINGEEPEPLTDVERWDLVEYIKTL